MTDFANVSGMTAEQFKDAWSRSPAEAIQLFLVGLSKMSEEGVNAIATLEDMGLKEVRLRDTLMRATNASALFSKAVDMSNAAWKENTALTKEASTRYGTMKSQLEIMKNKYATGGYVSGVIVAAMGRSPKTEGGGLDSKTGFVGLAKKGLIIVMVLLATMLDRALGTEAMVFQTSCSAFISPTRASVA